MLYVSAIRPYLGRAIVDPFLHKNRGVIEPGVERSLPPGDFSGGRSGNNRAGRNIASHNRAGCHNCSVTDRNSGKNNRPEGDPDMIPDSNLSADSFFKIVRMRIVTERQKRRFRADRNIVSCSDRKFSSIEKASEIDDVSLSEKNFSAV